MAPSHHHHDHDHAHGPGHHHAPGHFGRAFLIGIGLNLIYVLIESLCGFFAHSLALLADAGHNFGDVIGLAAAWGASILSKREPSERFTYGLRRSSILTALANGIVLLVVTGGIVAEAVNRFFAPAPSAGGAIMIVAGIGIAVNGFTAWLFASGRKGDINIRAAFLHMLSDAVVTAGVLIGGWLILLTGWQWIDPAISLLVSLVIVAGTWSLLKDSVCLALDGVPQHVSSGEVEAYLRSLPDIVEVHDLHIWALSTTETALTVHLVHLPHVVPSALLPSISEVVRQRFAIGHVTVQMETLAIAEDCGLRSQHVV